MHALVVLAHPEPRSFNAALKDVAVATLEAAGHRVEVSDLYAQGFDPSEAGRHYPERADADFFSAQAEQRHASDTRTLPAEVRAEIAKLERADLVIFQYPLWWHAQPAMLKGWLDRVLVYGDVYTGSVRYNHGHFRGRRAICSVTCGAPEATFAHNGRSGDIDLLMWPMNYSLHYVGYSVLRPFLCYGVQGGGVAYRAREEAERMLEGYKTAWARRLQGLAEETPLRFAGLDDWDEHGILKPGLRGWDYFIRAEP